MSTREQNYEQLVQVAIEQHPDWGWTTCCVCEAPSTTAGVVFLPMTASLARVGWCDQPECQEDMAVSKPALPTVEAAVALAIAPHHAAEES